MNLKNILKQLKLNESTISMILGACVIVIIGLLVVNYFRNLKPTGNTIPEALTTERVTLPTTHTVAAGETLWDISERYYESGYNWVDIQTENKLSDANAISEGQVLNIPNVSRREVTATETSKPTVTTTPVATTIATATPKPVVATPSATTTSNNEATVTGDSYTIVRGDTLWSISIKAYGNGYKWLDIAKANKLANPNVIHAGNSLTLPR